MKRSLTIGCVLLVGGGVSNCGGSAETGANPGEPQGSHAGASGSGAVGGGSVGNVPSYGGGGGVPPGIGSVGVAGRAVGTEPPDDPAGQPGLIGEAGAGGDWEMGVGGGAGPLAGEGGVSGWGDEQPQAGTGPRGGTGGGWVGIPPK
jgi:hypothetical protein